jgi:Tol biopolymer transport system component
VTIRARWLLLLTLLLASLLPASSNSIRAQEVPGSILFVREGGIWRWENGEASPIWKEEGLSDARWSPDGQSVLFVRSGNSYSDLLVLNLSTSVVTQLTYNQSGEEMGTLGYTESSFWAVDPSWALSGRIGYASDAAGAGTPLALWLIDGVEGSPYPAPLLAVEEEIDSVSLSGDGLIAAYVMRQRFDDGTSDTNVWLRDLTTGETFLAAQSSGEVFDPALSPEGTQLAVAIRDESGATDLWLVDRASLERTRITRDGAVLAPSWSSDGRWLAYVKMNDFQFEVWAAPVRRGKVGDGQKLFTAKGLDSRSGISWHVPDE